MGVSMLDFVIFNTEKNRSYLFIFFSNLGTIHFMETQMHTQKTCFGIRIGLWEIQQYRKSSLVYLDFNVSHHL